MTNSLAQLKPVLARALRDALSWPFVKFARWRRTWVLCLAAFCAMLLQGCVEVTTVEPAIFKDQSPEVEFDIDISQLAGGIDEQAFIQHMAAQPAFVEIDYLPTKTLWLINANLSLKLRGQAIPVPQLVLKPKTETVRLNSRDYHINERHIHFKVDRKISTYYTLHDARVLIPNLVVNSVWPSEPLRLQIHLISNPDVLGSIDSRKPLQERRFVFDSNRYAAAGSVKVSNAYVSIDTVDGITTDTSSPSAQAALVGSKFSGYEKSLLSYQPTQSEPGRLIQKVRAIQARRQHPPVRDGEDASKCNCQSTSQQDEVEMNEYLSWWSRYDKARDWKNIAIYDTQYPSSPPNLDVLQTDHVQAKAEGHLLDSLRLTMRQGEFKSNECTPESEYKLFFVDRKLVSYRTKSFTCLDTEKKQVTLTHAKWSDQGQPVYFYQACESCKDASVTTHADTATWVAMEKFGVHVATQVLRSPNVLGEIEGRRHP